MSTRQLYRIPTVQGELRSDPLARWIAFTGAPELSLGQAWRSEPEADFSPASVRVMWDSSGLLIAANLEDEDMVSPAAGSSGPAFTSGDAFEIFLRPLAIETYLELHVTPDNIQLSLRFPAAGGAKFEELDRFTIETCFSSNVKVDRVASSWTVAADVPWEALGMEGRTGAELLASFSRYDYTDGREQPVVSSTSPHAECNFHRQQEWARLVLA